ncbi:MAG: class I SAM-dependent methyltransferase [Thermoanaerobacteraceae bacterium]|nr:class I SAM-dependent methyltransferase [Thermoanaerobacteraceae bacterium]
MNNLKYFDNMAHKWDEIVKHDYNKIDFVLDMLDMAEGDKVLDVGTGTGVLILPLLKRVGNRGHITAIDTSKEMLEVAKKKYNHPNVNFIEANIENFSAKAESYDYIFFYSVFPHIEDKVKAIENAHKLLKNNGSIIIFHSENRKAINKLHSQIPGLSDHILPPPDEIMDILDKNHIECVNSIDNEDMFLVIGENRLV